MHILGGHGEERGRQCYGEWKGDTLQTLDASGKLEMGEAYVKVWEATGAWSTSAQGHGP